MANLTITGPNGITYDTRLASPYAGIPLTPIPYNVHRYEFTWTIPNTPQAKGAYTYQFAIDDDLNPPVLRYLQGAKNPAFTVNTLLYLPSISR